MPQFGQTKLNRDVTLNGRMLFDMFGWNELVQLQTMIHQRMEEATPLIEFIERGCAGDKGQNITSPANLFTSNRLRLWPKREEIG